MPTLFRVSMPFLFPLSLKYTGHNFV